MLARPLLFVYLHYWLQLFIHKFRDGLTISLKVEAIFLDIVINSVEFVGITIFLGVIQNHTSQCRHPRTSQRGHPKTSQSGRHWTSQL